MPPVTQPSTYPDWDTLEANLLPVPSPLTDSGYVPGMAPACEYDNGWQNLVGKWVRWLQQQQAAGGGYTSVTTSQTVATTYATYFAAPAAANINLTLPSSSGTAGQIWRLKNTAFGTTNTVTILLANALDSLEGTVNGSVVLNPGEILVVQSDGLGNYFQLTP